MSEQAKAAPGAYVAGAVEGHSLDKEDIHKAAWGDNLEVEAADKGRDSLRGKPRLEEDPPSRPELLQTLDSDQIGAKSPRGSDPNGEKVRSKVENGEEGPLQEGGLSSRSDW